MLVAALLQVVCAVGDGVRVALAAFVRTLGREATCALAMAWPQRTPPSARARDLALRLSPGFDVVLSGKLTPLRLLSQVDGFGRLGLYMVFSPHLGAEPLRPYVDEILCEEDPAREDPLALAHRPDRIQWGIMTEQLHDAHDRAAEALTVVAVRPDDCKEETAAAVRAGLLRPLRRMSAARAPLYEIVGLGTGRSIRHHATKTRKRRRMARRSRQRRRRRRRVAGAVLRHRRRQLQEHWLLAASRASVAAPPTRGPICRTH